MKIGIITFHFVSNQGALLQCYALQTFLQKMGFDVRIIDYRPKYHTIRYSTWKNPFMYARWYWRRFHKHTIVRRFYLTVRSFVRCIVMNLLGTDRYINKLVNLFIENNFHLTKRYTSLKQLQADPPEMDAYISGSDQLWNTELLDHEFDHAYFLDFGKPHIKRIIYAVSMGKSPTDKELSQLKDLCKDLTAISIREYDEATVNAIGRDVHICVDPTLLLNEEDYFTIESNDISDEPYIFVYGFETNNEFLSAVDMAVKKYRCRVINGSPTKIKLPGKVEKIRNYTPNKFLALIKNATCVITNSFHGTAFSIIYKKKFITIPHSTRGKRMIELLDKLGLNCCLWGSKEFSFDSENDYSNTYKKLQVLRNQSMKFLSDALNGKYEEVIKHNPGEPKT